jgi:hypothetical protein
MADKHASATRETGSLAIANRNRSFRSRVAGTLNRSKVPGQSVTGRSPSTTRREATAAVIIDMLSIDPILAVRMIHRSTEEVWPKIMTRVLGFTVRWHRPDTALRRVMDASCYESIVNISIRICLTPDDQMSHTYLTD